MEVFHSFSLPADSVEMTLRRGLEEGRAMRWKGPGALSDHMDIHTRGQE